MTRSGNLLETLDTPSDGKGPVPGGIRGGYGRKVTDRPAFFSADSVGWNPSRKDAWFDFRKDVVPPLELVFRAGLVFL